MTHSYLHLFKRTSRVIGRETAEHSHENGKNPVRVDV